MAEAAATGPAGFSPSPITGPVDDDRLVDVDDARTC
jgi:hypothetical protein